MKIILEAQTIFRKIMKMDSHPMIWITFQLCLVMHSQLVQAIVGSNFHHQCPDQCLCLSQIQVSQSHNFNLLSIGFKPWKTNYTNLIYDINNIQTNIVTESLFHFRLYYIEYIIIQNNKILVVRIRKCSQYSTI